MLMLTMMMSSLWAARSDWLWRTRRGQRRREGEEVPAACWLDGQAAGWMIQISDQWRRLAQSYKFHVLQDELISGHSWSAAKKKTYQCDQMFMWQKNEWENRLQTVRAAEQLSWLHFLCRTNSWQRKRKGLMKDEGLMWWRERRRRMKGWEAFDVQKQPHWMKSVHHQRY